MEIILLKDVEKVGEKHEVVDVKPGYARNYLIPQRLAIVANESNSAKLNEIKRKEEEELLARRAEFEELKEKLEGKVLKIGAKSGTSEKIFGSVTNIQIANALEEQLGIEVDRKKIEMPEEIKTLGTYTAELNLHPDVDIKVYFEVVAE